VAIQLHYLQSLSIRNYHLVSNYTSFPREGTTSPRSFIFVISGSGVGLFRTILEQSNHPYRRILLTLFTISCTSSPLTTLQLRLYSRIGLISRLFIRLTMSLSPRFHVRPTIDTPFCNSSVAVLALPNWSWFAKSNLIFRCVLP
jgi:hypothetical protein